MPLLSNVKLSNNPSTHQQLRRETIPAYWGSMKSSSGSGNKGGSGGGGGTSASPVATMSYAQMIADAQKDAADRAYRNNVSALNKAYAQRSELLENNLNSTLDNLQTDYDASRDSVNKDASNSLKEAYINNMLSRKNLAQNMAAQGLSGGASETTMAGMYNNYGNARNNIQTVANENLGNLENLYNQNKNSAYQAYNDQLAQDAITKAQYLAQFEADRQNALATAYNNQLSQLANLDPSYLAGMVGLVDNQAAYEYTGTKANNAPKAVSTEQGGGATKATYGNLLNRAVQMSINGASSDDVIMDLANQGVDEKTIANILSQLRY